MRTPWVRVERSICSSDHQQLKHSHNAASARTNPLKMDIADAGRQDHSGHMMESTTHGAGGARHWRGRQNPSKGSAHWGVSMTPVCSAILGSTNRTASTRGAEIA